MKLSGNLLPRYRLATSKIAVWNFYKDLSVLHCSLMHEQRERT